MFSFVRSFVRSFFLAFFLFVFLFYERLNIGADSTRQGSIFRPTCQTCQKVSSTHTPTTDEP